MKLNLYHKITYLSIFWQSLTVTVTSSMSERFLIEHSMLSFSTNTFIWYSSCQVILFPQLSIGKIVLQNIKDVSLNLFLFHINATLSSTSNWGVMLSTTQFQKSLSILDWTIYTEPYKYSFLQIGSISCENLFWGLK